MTGKGLDCVERYASARGAGRSAAAADPRQFDSVTRITFLSDESNKPGPQVLSVLR